MPLRELLAVRPEDEAVVDHLRQLAADRPGDPPLQLEVRPMVGAADHVSHREVEVVDDRGELIRGRAVRAQQSGAVSAQAHGSLVVSSRSAGAQGTLGGSRVQRPPLALSNRPLVVRTPSHSRSARIAASPPSALRAGSVSSMRSRSTPPWSSA